MLLLGVPAAVGTLAFLRQSQALRHAKRLATRRPGIAPATLIDHLIAAGVREPVMDFVWDRIAPYYADGAILPHPDDDLDKDARIDPDDVEDIVADFFQRFSLPEPTRQQSEMIPSPLSVHGLAAYLDRRLCDHGQDSDALTDTLQRSPNPA